MATLTDRCNAIKLFLSDVDGVLTDGSMYYGEGGDELKRFSTLDGGGFILLRLVGIECGLITGEKSPIVDRRAKKIGLAHVIQGARDKSAELDRLLAKRGFSEQEVAYIGDDINDIMLINRVGVSATVPGNCLPADVKTDYVTTRPGGSGAVRDFAEWLLRERADYDEAVRRYLEESRAQKYNGDPGRT